MNIEEIIKRFVDLASKPSLSKVEHNEAVDLMKKLKEAGITNDEISKLSKGKRTPSTIKFYTPGIRATHPSPWEDAVVLLNDLISTGLTLDDVEMAVSLHQTLKEKDITLDQVVDLIATTDAASIDLDTLIQAHENLMESGLSLNDVQETLKFRKELVRRDISLDSLLQLVELVRKYGAPEQVIDAVSKYSSLTELQEQNEIANKELEDTRQELVSLHQEIDQACDKLSQMEEPIEACEKVKSLGFTEEILNRLSDLTYKYGGVVKMLKAIETFTDYSDIIDKVNKAKTNLAKLEAKTAQLETSHSHLKTAIDMCDTLIRKYKFGLDAIATIFSVAKKYGEPLELLKAIEAYGKLQSVQQELEKLEARVGERNKLFRQLESRHNEMLDKLESLNATTLQVGVEVGSLEDRLANSKYLEKVMNLINRPQSAEYEEHAPVVYLIASGLYKWVDVNSKRFSYSYSIKSGLQYLINELEGKR